MRSDSHEIHARPSFWMLVTTGPALRTSLIGGILVAEASIGKTFGLSDAQLAILLECLVFGGLLAIFLLPPLVRTLGNRIVSITAAVLAAVFLATAMLVGPLMTHGTAATAGLFGSAVLLGIFVAIPSPVSQSMLNHSTADAPKLRATLQSAWSAGQPIGFIAAAFIGGLLVEVFGWWAALAVPLVISIVLALSLVHPDTEHPDRDAMAEARPPFSEIAIVIIAMVAFEIWSTWGSLASWFDPAVLGSMLATIAILAWTVGHMRRVEKPAISMRPFESRGFAAAIAILLLYQLPTTSEFEVLLLTELYNVSDVAIGNRTSVGNAAQVIGSALAAVLLVRGQGRFAIVAGFGAAIIGLASYRLYFHFHGDVLITFTRAITGVGGGLLLPVLFVAAMRGTKPATHFAASTWLVLATIGGTELGLALFEMLLSTGKAMFGSSPVPYRMVESMQLLTMMTAGLLATWAISTGRLIVNPAQKTKTEDAA